MRVLDFGVESGVPYLVMDYAAGGTLRQHHPKSTRLSAETVLLYVQQVASALQYAHDHKIIHRDVKPENMLLFESGEVLLSDFGIAIVSQSSRYQRTQDTAGTIAYMAPEQIQAHPRPASDQYSLGIVIYEWFVGERPFTGSMSEVLAKQLSVSPPPLREKRRDLSPALEQVVLTALEKDPKARFISVQAFARAFEQAIQSGPPTVIRTAPELPPTLPAVAPPVTTPQQRAVWAKPTSGAESPATSGPFAPTRRTPPQPKEPPSHVQGAAPSALPLAPTVRAAAPSPVPAAGPTRSRAKPWWAKGPVVSLIGLVLVIGSLLGLGFAGQGPLTSGGPSPNGATPTTTPNGAMSSGTVTEFAVPTANSQPASITTGPDGNFWFTEHNGNHIGRITPRGAITEFAVPFSTEGGITAGPDGNVWFAESLGNQIGRITPSGTVTAFAVPTANSDPDGITAGLDGNLWFTEHNGSQIGRITPSGTVTEFALPTALDSSQPGDITAGPDGNLWFTLGFGSNQIGRITPSGTVTGFAVPAAPPDGITAGPDGNLWFTQWEGSQIGRITPSGAITEFALPTASGPYGITASPDGNLWFTELASDGIGRITPSGTSSEFAVLTASGPDGITASPDGNLWFTEFNSNRIGRITPSGTSTAFVLPTSTSQPWGSIAGLDENLWFTEPGGNPDWPK